MIGIVYSKLDAAGTNMAEFIAKSYEFEAVENEKNLRYRGEAASIYEVDTLPFQADMADGFECDHLLFLSRHKSEADVDAFTTHSLGNWRPSADFGGKPKQLSAASPLLMLSALIKIRDTAPSVDKTYEATHHGPLLKTPSLFVELGGSDRMIGDKTAAATVAKAAFAAVTDMANEEVDYQKVAVGIGSNHYPQKFSELAVSKGYAFSHIMPKYAILNEDGSSNLDVLEQALDRSEPKPELAVIDWKSLSSIMKEETIKKLNEIGLDNEKI